MGGPCYCDGREWDAMDNFLVAPFVIKNTTYASCEQYFQVEKFVEEDYKSVMLQETDGDRLWSLGQSRKHAIREDWVSWPCSELGSKLTYLLASVLPLSFCTRRKRR
jgi:predicted NAD-dependent protein-ADP-ribosyltransferase YbiA (DUF1768 family)